MNKSKPVSLAVCTALVGGLALSGSAFSMQPLEQGYLLAASAAADKPAEGKCGEGKCGMSKADADKDGKISRTEFATVHPGQPAKFDAIDSNKDGLIDAAEAKAHHAAEAKADKPAPAKGHAEGKCGEGKCGGKM